LREGRQRIGAGEEDRLLLMGQLAGGGEEDGRRRKLQAAGHGPKAITAPAQEEDRKRFARAAARFEGTLDEVGFQVRGRNRLVNCTAESGSTKNALSVWLAALECREEGIRQAGECKRRDRTRDRTLLLGLEAEVVPTPQLVRSR